MQQHSKLISKHLTTSDTLLIDGLTLWGTYSLALVSDTRL